MSTEAHEGRGRRIGRAVLATLVVGSGAAAGAVATTPPPPAAASEFPSVVSNTPPVTWMDALGRQLVAGIEVTGLPSAPVSRLVVARDRADGTPDPTWGGDGVAEVAPAPPAAGLDREPVVSVTAAGVLAATWTPAGCDRTGPCDRWYHRFTATGDPVGDPVLVTASDDRPVEPLPDGSFLTTDTAGAVGWRSSAGVDRGAPPLAATALDSATVDRSGRLLLADTARQVVRWPAGGPAQALATITGCGAGKPLVIGPSATENGFAATCIGAGSALRVERRGADGTLRWATTTTTDGIPVQQPTSALLDDLGRVWVGGSAGATGYPDGQVMGVVRAYARTGAGELGYHRRLGQILLYADQRITQLRQGPSHRVAVAHLQDCCGASSGSFPAATSYGAVAPAPVDLSASLRGSATVEAFVARHLRLLTGSAPPAAVAAGSAELRDGRRSPVGLVTHLLATGRGARQVEPVARLYRAAFLRTADIGGLRHYVGRVAGGTGLATIAEELSSSPEFRRRYGSLDDGAFLRTVYRNVFGREGDEAGMEYWYRRLRAGTVTRGGVIVQFAESGEHVRAQFPTVAPLAATFLLLDRRPSDDERADWAARLDPRRAAVEAVFAAGAG